MTLQEILAELYGGSEWTFHNHDGTGETYADLEWHDLEDEKPSEATIRAREAEAEATRAARELKSAHESIFRRDNPDALILAVQIMIDFCAEIYRVMPQQQKNSFSATILSRGQALKQRVEDIRAITETSPLR